MGLKDTRTKAIECLKAGTVQHEARDSIDEKNLLQTGAVTVEFVIKLLNATKGGEYSAIPHMNDANVNVHICEPEAKEDGATEKSRWYLKFYFVDPDLMFISVHKSHVAKGRSKGRKG